jgi:hypothetical protein
VAQGAGDADAGGAIDVGEAHQAHPLARLAALEAAVLGEGLVLHRELHQRLGAQRVGEEDLAAQGHPLRLGVRALAIPQRTRRHRAVVVGQEPSGARVPLGQRIPPARLQAVGGEPLPRVAVVGVLQRVHQRLPARGGVLEEGGGLRFEPGLGPGRRLGAAPRGEREDCEPEDRAQHVR